MAEYLICLGCTPQNTCLKEERKHMANKLKAEIKWNLRIQKFPADSVTDQDFVDFHCLGPGFSPWRTKIPQTTWQKSFLKKKYYD